jgi:hypothetical protein
VIAINIHGLLAERAGGRGRKYWEPEKALNACEVDTGLHNCILSIYICGHSGDPGVGVVHIEAPKALSVSLVGARYKAIKSFSVDGGGSGALGWLTGQSGFVQNSPQV